MNDAFQRIGHVSAGQLVRWIFPWRRFACMALIGLVSVLGGCCAVPVAHTDAPADSAGLYLRAIGDSAIASEAKVRPLLAIPQTDTVQVVAWVSASSQFCAGGGNQCQYTVGKNGTFVSLDGEVKNKCLAWELSGDALRKRLEQLLGLPPDQPVQYQKSSFVVLAIPSGHLQRPCAGLGDNVDGHPTCSIRLKSSPEISPLEFLGGQMAGSYISVTSGSPGYPFTRLGYTYDWSPVSADHYGASEFILVPGTVATVKAQMSTDEYCAHPK
jgi:hypothetical protein